MDHSMAMSSISSMSMAMSSMSSAMSGMASATGMSMPSSSASASSGMGGMSMGGGGCKISMLWNWNTIDACFIARSWRVTSTGMFAGSCVGVILLVLLLELLGRAGKEYDRLIVAQHAKALAAGATTLSSSSSAGTSKVPLTSAAAACAPVAAQTFRPNVLQQVIRALLHTCQFAVAYFVMLLAMYYNGYFIICIFIGAFLGFFVFGWEVFNVSKAGQDRMQENSTVCCG